MKALLLQPPWGELDGLRPLSGRPHLDLLLATLGWESLECRELTGGHPGSLDQGAGPRLILARDDGEGQVGRALLTALREEEGPSRTPPPADPELATRGVTLLRGEGGQPLGFALHRPGSLAVCCRGSLWDERGVWLPVVEAFGLSQGPSRSAPRCWLVEGEAEAAATRRWLEGLLFPEPCRVQALPDGDWALWLPGDREESWYGALRRKLGHWLYAETPLPLEEVAGERLRRRGWRAVLAESCTAGLAAARLASVPGSSDYLEGGFVTYSNACKRAQLGVEEELLATHGAVSAPVARAMARGALAATGAEVAVAVTGIAGPGGGTAAKPVGTVHLCGVTRWGQEVPRLVRFPGGREQVRWRSGQAALHVLRRLAEEHLDSE